MQRCWELYLGATLLSRGFRLARRQSGTPDLCVLKGNGDRVWIEAIAVGKGEGKDRVPDTEMGKVYDAPIQQILLRLSSAAQIKHRAFQKYIRDGIVHQSEACVIAINRSETEEVPADPEIPLILKALFGIGDLQISYALGQPGDRASLKGYSWTSRSEVRKSNTAPVPMAFFRDRQFEEISAVMYCIRDPFNGPYLANELGENVCVVHNPFASQPLPQNFFHFGSEYKAVGESVMKLRDGKSHRVMFELLEHYDLVEPAPAD